MAALTATQQSEVDNNNHIRKSDWGGSLRVMTADLDWEQLALQNGSANIDEGDTVALFTVPAGARIRYFIMQASNLTLLESLDVSIKVGIAGNVEKYVTEASNPGGIATSPMIFIEVGSNTEALAAAEDIILTPADEIADDLPSISVTCVYSLN